MTNNKHDNAEMVDLVLVAKDLLEICRIKCSPTDEVWRADGISNEQVMIAAVRAIHEAEHVLAKARADKAKVAKPVLSSSFQVANFILNEEVVRASLRKKAQASLGEI